MAATGEPTLAPRAPASAWPSPLAPFRALHAHADLVRRLAWRRVVVRYRGSLLGASWAVLSPLITLAIFTLVFGVMFGSRWSDEPDTLRYSLLLYLGLCVFWYLSECLGESATLLADHASYVKKVVFPLEALPWVVALTALFHLAIRLVVFGVAWTALQGPPPATIVLLPAALLPLVLTTLGLTYLVACAGALVRDLREGMALLLTALMFLSPILYPIHVVPEPFRAWLILNPLSVPVEMVRGVAAFGAWPSPGVAAASFAASWALAWTGLAFFMRLRGVFADVV
jgi:lipopolysaccharide transport system permease protein